MKNYPWKKSLYVPFLVIFYLLCCNISFDLNIFFALNYAGECAEEQSYLLKDKKKEKKESSFLLFYLL